MKIEIDRYQHFSFDLWLTLIKSNPLYKRKRDELLKGFFSIEQSIERVQAAVRYYDVLCNNISENTGVHFGRNEIYLLILSKLDVDIENIGNDKVLEFCHISEELFFDHKPELVLPHIHQIMRKIIEQGKTMNILSNTGFIHGVSLRNVLAYYELDSFFSFQLYSDETGFSKPNKRIFELVYEKTNIIKAVDRKAIVHIGDNDTADFRGALNVGFQAILINN